MKCFIMQSVLDVIGVIFRSAATAGEAGNTIDAADDSVGSNAMLQKRLKYKSIETLTLRKK